ncbi:MAG TPA: hypothetical protein VK528_11305 [Flavobacterium sp.]|nr:hypothetical protein [Flavobacterium sp.]
MPYTGDSADASGSSSALTIPLVILVVVPDLKSYSHQSRSA